MRTLPIIHMHQGGTLNTMCQLALAYCQTPAVAWNDADKVTCTRCLHVGGATGSLDEMHPDFDNRHP